MSTFHVDSEIGRLRKVIVHRPGLELRRLTPYNHDELLFDDILWVRKAVEQHDNFVAILRDQGVEPYLLEDLLAEALADEAARRWVVDVAVTGMTVGVGALSEVRDALVERDGKELAGHLIGGLRVSELREMGLELEHSLCAIARGDEAFVLSPLPNSMYTRDSSCWIKGGVVLSPMYYNARRLEVINMTAVYRFHPMFRDADFGFWFPKEVTGDFEIQDFGMASLEGGDVMPIGNGVVLVGISERTTARMAEQLALSLFEVGAAERVIACQMTRDRAHMHLDTVFTFLDRDAVTAFPPVVDAIKAYSLRPGTNGNVLDVNAETSFVGAVQDALGVKKLRVITTGGDELQSVREQWDDANNVVAIEPGVVMSYARNEFTNKKLEDAGIKVLTFDGSELGKGRGGGHCMTCPISRDSI